LRSMKIAKMDLNAIYDQGIACQKADFWRESYPFFEASASLGYKEAWVEIEAMRIEHLLFLNNQALKGNAYHQLV